MVESLKKIFVRLDPIRLRNLRSLIVHFSEFTAQEGRRYRQAMERSGYIAKFELWDYEETGNDADFFKKFTSRYDELLQNVNMDLQCSFKETVILTCHENKPYLLVNGEKLSVSVKSYKDENMIVSVTLNTPCIIDTQQISSAQPVVLER
jgi:hypothetical protein